MKRRPGTAGVQAFMEEMIACATVAEPLPRFLARACGIVLAFTASDSVEVRFRRKDRFTRWEMTRSPERLLRLGDVPEGTDAQAPAEIPPTGLEGASVQPLAIGDERIGVAIFRRERPYDEGRVESVRVAASALAMAIGFHGQRSAEKEREKELECLRRVGEASSGTASGIDAVLGVMVACLPPAWQYPEIARARITLDGKAFETPGGGEERHVQRARILVGEVARGSVEVIYTADAPDEDEGPFLEEERRLIDLVAGEIALVVLGKQASSDRSRLEQQLRHADRLATIGQLAAGVAHEINEPLGAILGFAQLARKHDGIPAGAVADLDRIVTAAMHAREVVRRLVLFARPAMPARKPSRINEIVEGSVSLLADRGEKDGIRVEYRLGRDIPELMVDPMQIGQVIVNLVVNAFQAMPGGGTVTIESSRSVEDVILDVSDTGPGIREELREIIFDPFFTTKKAGEGTGLGLSIVQGIVRAHGGSIEVESAKGSGSRFRIRLPIEEGGR